MTPENNHEKPEQPYPASGYAWLVVGVLTLVYIFSFIDRQILNCSFGQSDAISE